MAQVEKMKGKPDSGVVSDLGHAGMELLGESQETWLGTQNRRGREKEKPPTGHPHKGHCQGMRKAL